MNKLFFIGCMLLLIGCDNCKNCAVFIVNDFSDDYYGKICIKDTSVLYSSLTAGWVAIYDAKTDKKLIKVNAEYMDTVYYNYIIYDDFNFDGEKDFAIRDGINGCYRTDSYQIFLATQKGFKHSEAFTELVQGNCGMFVCDLDKKRIYTMTKSGCCWHLYSTFNVVDGELVPFKEIEMDAFEVDNTPKIEIRTFDGRNWDTIIIEYDEDFDDESIRQIKEVAENPEKE